MITKSQVITNQYTADTSSTNLIASDDSEVSTGSTTYVLKKTFNITTKLYSTSTFYIEYKLKEVGAGIASCDIRLNGVSQDIQTEDGVYVTKGYSTTAALKKGDIITLYLKHSAGAGDEAFLKEVRIYATLSPIS